MEIDKDNIIKYLHNKFVYYIKLWDYTVQDRSVSNECAELQLMMVKSKLDLIREIANELDIEIKYY